MTESEPCALEAADSDASPEGESLTIGMTRAVGSGGNGPSGGAMETEGGAPVASAWVGTVTNLHACRALVLITNADDARTCGSGFRPTLDVDPFLTMSGGVARPSTKRGSFGFGGGGTAGVRTALMVCATLSTRSPCPFEGCLGNTSSVPSTAFDTHLPMPCDGSAVAIAISSLSQHPTDSCNA